MPWQLFSISLPMASGMNLATSSFRSQLVASRDMISTIRLRMLRIYTHIHGGGGGEEGGDHSGGQQTG